MNKIKELYDKIKDKKYGWHDKEGNLHHKIREGDFLNDYRFQVLEDTNFEYAICWEICELERKVVKEEKLPYKTIFVFEKDNDKYPNHTFLVFKENDNYYWLEGSWIEHRGIHKYNSLKEIFDYFRDNFEDFSPEYKKENIIFYDYKEPKNINDCLGYYNHALSSEILNDDSVIN